MDKHGLRGLKDALAEAAGKFVPDRTVLPIPDKTFGGTAGRTLKDSVADWSFIPGPKAPEDAPNVLLVLIDDAGFGSIDSFGGPVSTPAFSRVQDMGITYNRFHVTAVCSPTRAALLTGRNQHRVGFGSIAEYPGPFPGYSASKPRSCAAFPRILKENGYVTGGFGKWHLTPDNVQGAAGPFDHWPKSWGFDHWWGFLSGAAGQYDPIITQDDWTLGVPEGKDGKLYYFPDDITDKAVEWLHAVRAQDAHKPWMVFYSTGCATPRTTWRPSGRTSTRASSTTAGTRCASARWRGRRSSASCRRTPSSPSAPTPSPPGTRSPTTRRSSTCARWRSTAGSRRTPTGTSAACWTPSRRWATSTTRSSSTSGATTAPAWRARPPARSTR